MLNDNLRVVFYAHLLGAKNRTIELPRSIGLSPLALSRFLAEPFLYSFSNWCEAY
jgi:hypothetical protein